MLCQEAIENSIQGHLPWVTTYTLQVATLILETWAGLGRNPMHVLFLRLRVCLEVPLNNGACSGLLDDLFFA